MRLYLMLGFVMMLVSIPISGTLGGLIFWIGWIVALIDMAQWFDNKMRRG